ncbi:MAG: ATP-binding protein [Pseudomonadota bacterium]
MSLLPFPAARSGETADAATSSAALLPRAPQSLDDSGLPSGFVVELLAKTMFQLGLTRLTELSNQLCLPATVLESVIQFMRKESLIEVLRRGQHEADQQFDLTLLGRARAADWLARNSYVGPAPVPLAAYVARVQAQSVTQQHITAAEVRQAFADLILPRDLMDRLGIAVNSGRPLLLYGEAGSGKTYLAERLQRLLGGPVAVPHAVLVHGEVIRIYDPLCHKALPEPAAPAQRLGGLPTLDGRSRADARWLLCQRPCVVTGGELTMAMLDLSFDARAGFYEAPPHFKANNGLFIVDDLGRQVVTPRELMNRWIVPMERRHDHLMLRNGAKFTVPFDMVLVFSSNLRPAQLEDAAFLRRLGHKIEVGALPVDHYRRVFQQVCASEGLAFDDAAFELLLRDYHAPSGRSLQACYPRDLVHLISSRAAYLDEAPVLSPAMLDWAWHAYFATDSPAATPQPEGAR